MKLIMQFGGIVTSLTNCMTALCVKAMLHSHQITSLRFSTQTRWYHNHIPQFLLCCAASTSYRFWEISLQIFPHTAVIEVYRIISSQRGKASSVLMKAQVLSEKQPLSLTTERRDWQPELPAPCFQSFARTAWCCSMALNKSKCRRWYTDNIYYPRKWTCG